ncbi:hypothetical protein MMC22_009174 [Lobaria immixta]|nr:hypothetical protein [Lobaria immixta]
MNARQASFRSQSEILGGIEGPPSTVQLTGKASARQYTSQDVFKRLQLPNPFENRSDLEAVVPMSTTQQAVIADALTSVGTIWNVVSSYSQTESHHGVSLYDEQKAIHTIANNYYQPYSSAFCVRDVIQGPNDQSSVAFPIPPAPQYKSEYLLPHFNASLSGFPALEVPSLRRAQLLKLPGLESENRVKWVQLPRNPLAGVSVGFVVLLPKTPLNPVEQTTSTMQTNTDIVVCNIGAGWGASSINMTVNRGYNSATSSLTKFDPQSLLGKDKDYSPPYANRFQSFTDQLVLFEPPSFPSIPVEIDVEWAQYLNPYVPSANTTVIDFLLRYLAKNGSKSSLPEIVTAGILSSLVTNGLARSSFTSELQGNIRLAKDKTHTGNLTGNSLDLQGEIPDGSIWFSGKSDMFTVDQEESKDWVKLQLLKLPLHFF